jgi:hypothetical protein
VLWQYGFRFGGPQYRQQSNAPIGFTDLLVSGFCYLGIKSAGTAPPGSAGSSHIVGTLPFAFLRSFLPLKGLVIVLGIITVLIGNDLIDNDPTGTGLITTPLGAILPTIVIGHEFLATIKAGFNILRHIRSP